MKITAIIPSLNEEESIAEVISIARGERLAPADPNPLRKLLSLFVFEQDALFADEVIVVDDHSTDNTVARAKETGADVIISAKRGKGASMREGLLMATGDVVAFLDADIPDYLPTVVDQLVKPIVSDRADFTKATFDRQAGRVTELVAKPLLGLLFPEAMRFSQPLSGMIAGRREMLMKVEFENDYGVDIGILLDMIAEGARIEEVSLGRIANKMKQWQQLAPMSRDVARAILKRVKRRANYTLEAISSSTVVLDQLDFAIKESLQGLKKIAIFDLDNTILEGRVIEKLAEQYGFQKAFLDIVSENPNPYVTTKLVAQLIKGLDFGKMLSAVNEIPIVPDTAEVIAELKTRGYIVGIITDGYEFIAQHVGQKIGADFVMANELEFSNGIATGEVKVPSFFTRARGSVCHHDFCKSNAMIALCDRYQVHLENVMAIGDGENDICMVRHAGVGIAFCSQNVVLNRIADKVLTERRFQPLLEYAL
ncbi:glycosyltransferase [candidate division KSB1 bacterium]|nr:MAG: glycosyltransferase [candidate division KSB1 bacterium]